MKEAMREGRYVWNAAFGYSNTKIIGKTNIIPNDNAVLVKKLFLEVAKNVRPLDSIRKDKAFSLNDKHPTIPKTTFYRMLRNEIYTGRIKKFGETHKGIFEPIIDDELFDQVQRVVKRRKNNVMDYKKDHPDFPLRRFIEHYPSGHKMTGSWSKGHLAKYAYYRFRNHKESYPKLTIEKLFTEFLDKFSIDESDFTILGTGLKENLVAKTVDMQKLYFQTQKRIDDLKRKEVVLIEKNYKGTINDTVLTRQLTFIEDELVKEYSNLHRYEEKKPNYMALLRLASDYLKTSGKIWAEISFEKKLAIQRFQFPEGILFDGKKFGTSKIVSIYNVNSVVLNQKDRRGYFEIKKLNKLHTYGFDSEEIKDIYWQDVGKYLKDIGDILIDPARNI